MKRRFTIQIHTGGYDTAPAQLDVPAVLGKLSRIYENAHIDCVMIGWNPRAEIDVIVDFLKERGTDVYLWLPVFSGLDGLSPLIGTDGKPVVHSYKAEKGERFDFGCPVDLENLRRFKLFFETHFRGRHFDGVFLDKIRFPSFISGSGPVLTCFCPYCTPLHKISGEIELFEGENPLSLTSYSGLRYTMADKRLARLFDYKANAVTTAIAELADFFRVRGYKVGLDLFAPYLSFFVGQDYAGLAPHADFIKPMFYRETYAPAGLPFELDMYANAFGGDPDVIASRKRFLLDVLSAPAIDVDFINREIAGIRNVIGDTKLYAGIEINYNERIAPVTARYIRENITGLKNADGFALSWDLCSTPDENIDAVLSAANVPVHA